jgi:hypothetical protein
VQRALLRDDGQSALVELINERLAGVSEPLMRPWVEAVRSTLRDTGRAIAGWSGLSTAERELGARPVADLLYHLLAAALLLGEGQVLRGRSGDCRKFLAAALYVRKWLRPTAAGQPVFGPQQLECLDALADWTPVAPERLARV